jgi:hypothetical protein
MNRNRPLAYTSKEEEEEEEEDDDDDDDDDDDYKPFCAKKERILHGDGIKYSSRY